MPKTIQKHNRRSDSKEHRQLLVRLSPSEDAYLASVVPQKRQRAAYIRKLLAREKARRERKALEAMFAAAAKDIADEDREARRLLVSGFSNRE